MSRKKHFQDSISILCIGVVNWVRHTEGRSNRSAATATSTSRGDEESA
ncbi:MAG TPA: hypothetical protein VMT12_03555 [Syntrophales bacterium]|nr:hypothetical protein [Syntrophales bacterium]